MTIYQWQLWPFVWIQIVASYCIYGSSSDTHSNTNILCKCETNFILSFSLFIASKGWSFASSARDSRSNSPCSWIHQKPSTTRRTTTIDELMALWTNLKWWSRNAFKIAPKAVRNIAFFLKKILICVDKEMHFETNSIIQYNFKNLYYTFLGF